MLSVDDGRKRLELSLMSKKQAERRALAEAAISPGEAFTGIVRAVKTGEAGASAAMLSVDLMDDKQRVGSGQLEAAHLSDHPSGAEALMEVIQVGKESCTKSCSLASCLELADSSKDVSIKSIHCVTVAELQRAVWRKACTAFLQVGTNLGPVLVLERLQRARSWRLTRKGSILRAAEALPKTFEDVTKGQLLHGFVANVHNDCVFVRFLNGLTGRAGQSASPLKLLTLCPVKGITMYFLPKQRSAAPLLLCITGLKLDE